MVEIESRIMHESDALLQRALPSHGSMLHNSPKETLGPKSRSSGPDTAFSSPSSVDPIRDIASGAILPPPIESVLHRIQPRSHNILEKTRLMRVEGLYEWVKTILLGISIMPVRFLLFIFSILFAFFIAKIALIGAPKLGTAAAQQPLPRWRQWLLCPLPLCARLGAFALGFHWVEEIGRRERDKRQASIIVSNHVTLVEPFLLFARTGACVMSELGNAIGPMATIMQANQSLLIDRSAASAADRDSIKEALRTRARDQRFPQLLIFPEGTCSNGQGLLSFRAGAFLSGMPVQPVAVHYPHRWFDPGWVTDNGGMVGIALRLMCQFHNRVVIEWLPPYHPSTEEMENPQKYATNVQNAIARSLPPLTPHQHTPMTLYSYTDVRLESQALRVHAPATYAQVEAHALVHAGLQLDTASIRTALRVYLQTLGYKRSRKHHPLTKQLFKAMSVCKDPRELVWVLGEWYLQQMQRCFRVKYAPEEYHLAFALQGGEFLSSNCTAPNPRRRRGTAKPNAVAPALRTRFKRFSSLLRSTTAFPSSVLRAFRTTTTTTTGSGVPLPPPYTPHGPHAQYAQYAQYQYPYYHTGSTATSAPPGILVPPQQLACVVPPQGRIPGLRFRDLQVLAPYAPFLPSPHGMPYTLTRWQKLANHLYSFLFMMPRRTRVLNQHVFRLQREVELRLGLLDLTSFWTSIRMLRTSAFDALAQSSVPNTPVDLVHPSDRKKSKKRGKHKKKGNGDDLLHASPVYNAPGSRSSVGGGRSHDTGVKSTLLSTDSANANESKWLIASSTSATTYAATDNAFTASVSASSASSPPTSGAGALPTGRSLGRGQPHPIHAYPQDLTPVSGGVDVAAPRDGAVAVAGAGFRDTVGAGDGSGNGSPIGQGHEPRVPGTGGSSHLRSAGGGSGNAKHRTTLCFPDCPYSAYESNEHVPVTVRYLFSLLVSHAVVDKQQTLKQKWEVDIVRAQSAPGTTVPSRLFRSRWSRAAALSGSGDGSGGVEACPMASPPPEPRTPSHVSVNIGGRRSDHFSPSLGISGALDVENSSLFPKLEHPECRAFGTGCGGLLSFREILIGLAILDFRSQGSLPAGLLDTLGLNSVAGIQDGAEGVSHIGIGNGGHDSGAAVAAATQYSSLPNVHAPLPLPLPTLTPPNSAYECRIRGLVECMGLVFHGLLWSQHMEELCQMHKHSTTQFPSRFSSPKKHSSFHSQDSFYSPNTSATTLATTASVAIAADLPSHHAPPLPGTAHPTPSTASATPPVAHATWNGAHAGTSMHASADVTSGDVPRLALATLALEVTRVWPDISMAHFESLWATYTTTEQFRTAFSQLATASLTPRPTDFHSVSLTLYEFLRFLVHPSIFPSVPLGIQSLLVSAPSGTITPAPPTAAPMAIVAPVPSDTSPVGVATPKGPISGPASGPASGLPSPTSPGAPVTPSTPLLSTSTAHSPFAVATPPPGTPPPGTPTAHGLATAAVAVAVAVAAAEHTPPPRLSIPVAGLPVGATGMYPGVVHSAISPIPSVASVTSVTSLGSQPRNDPLPAHSRFRDPTATDLLSDLETDAAIVQAAQELSEDITHLRKWGEKFTDELKESVLQGLEQLPLPPSVQSILNRHANARSLRMRSLDASENRTMRRLREDDDDDEDYDDEDEESEEDDDEESALGLGGFVVDGAGDAANARSSPMNTSDMLPILQNMESVTVESEEVVGTATESVTDRGSIAYV